jgi:hypothetical protein
MRFIVVFEANTMFPRKGDAPAPANNLAKQKIMKALTSAMKLCDVPCKD